MFLQLLTGLSLLEIVLGAACDRNFISSSGTVTSPEYYSRSTYANSQSCQYDIRVGAGNAIKLTWSVFDIKGKMPSCSDDYVEIFIGCGRHSIGKYCSDNMNSIKPHDIYSPDNCLRIKFRSDSSGSGLGFSASYSAISFSYGIRLYSTCYTEYSAGSFYSSSDIISSNKWPREYSALQDCYWKIEVGSNKNVKIAFMDLDLEYDVGCDDDKVKVKGGRDYQSYDSSVTIKNSMCGTKSAFYFTSTRERIWIRFKSNSFRSGRGFVAGYVTYDSTSGSGSSGSSSSSSGGVVAGIVVAIIVILVFAGCIYYVFVYRRRLAMRQPVQQQAMIPQVHAPPPQAVVHHPPPPNQPGYGPPPPAGYAPPPPAGYAPPPPAGYGPPPQPGYAPPPYSQAVAAPYPQQDKTAPYPPAPQGGAPPYPPGQPGGAPPYPSGQPGGVAPYPPEGAPPGGTAPYPTAPPGGTAPYPTAPPGGSAPYPSAPPGGAPYPPQ